jgi:Tol biopolymer transport system component
MKRFITVLATAVAASTALLGAASAHAAASKENGPIAFRRFFNPSHTWGAIFTINPDGTGLRQITHPSKGVLTNEPNWSPDGQWIAYQRSTGDNARLYKIRADGSDRIYLSGTCTGMCLEDVSPDWSPNGRLIAFTRAIGPCDEFHTPCRIALYTMHADGTHVRQVTQQRVSTTVRPKHRVEDGGPGWSPDGTRLVFERRNDDRFLGPGLIEHAIFTVRLDGTGLRRLTPWGLDAAQPDWSPDGHWILFHSHENGDRQDNAFLVHPNGTDLHRVTHTFTGGESTWGGSSFSPDGTMITTAHKPGVGKPGNPDIWVMNLDGSGLRDVTNSVIWDSAPDWGPSPS